MFRGLLALFSFVEPEVECKLGYSDQSSGMTLYSETVKSSRSDSSSGRKSVVSGSEAGVVKDLQSTVEKEGVQVESSEENRRGYRRGALEELEFSLLLIPPPPPPAVPPLPFRSIAAMTVQALSTLEDTLKMFKSSESCSEDGKESFFSRFGADADNEIDAAELTLPSMVTLPPPPSPPLSRTPLHLISGGIHY